METKLGRAIRCSDVLNSHIWMKRHNVMLDVMQIELLI
jgi:hypothetical protein